MLVRYRVFCAALSAAIVIGFTGCSKSEESSSVKNGSSAVDASSVNTSSSLENASSQSDSSNIGEYLKKTAQIFKSKKYTMNCTVTNSTYDGEIKLIRVINGNNIYQLQQEAAGSYGVISVDGKSYDFDFTCGMYQKTDSVNLKNIVEEVVNSNLPMSSDVDTDSQEGMVTEQYTFTGDTYITNITFYFDEKTEELKKYIMKYTIEGQDDITETRIIDSLSEEVDESVFDLGFLEQMTDFGSMTEDQRMGFCQGICTSKGITVEILNQAGITVNDFKTIDFETFFDLIYTNSSINQE